MTPKQFVAQQLARPTPLRVIPDRLYVWDNRAGDIETLREGHHPYNASDVFIPDVYYENASYFSPNGAGRLRNYPNGVFSV